MLLATPALVLATNRPVLAAMAEARAHSCTTAREACEPPERGGGRVPPALAHAARGAQLALRVIAATHGVAALVAHSAARRTQ